jgi:hypothetical protein
MGIEKYKAIRKTYDLTDLTGAHTVGDLQVEEDGKGQFVFKITNSTKLHKGADRDALRRIRDLKRK